jgi:Transposase DDE domain
VFNDLFQQDLRLFTGIRKNMKNHLLELKDKKLSCKRVLLESVFSLSVKTLYP